MLDALLKALSFVFIMALGYGLKRIKFFEQNDYRVVVKIVTKITLPAAVVVSFSDSQLELSMLFVTLLSLGINIAMLVLGSILSRKKTHSLRALYGLAVPGYNIGAFAMPFTQSILGAEGAAVTCLFDTGNAIMCTGGSYAVTYTALHKGVSGSPSLWTLCKQLCGSFPFITYTTMLVLTLLGISLPDRAVEFIRPISNANPYCAMLMMGMMFELHFPKKTLQAVWHIVLIRTAAALLLSFGFYFLLPVPELLRRTLAVLVFAPGSILTPSFVEKCGGDASAASCVSSLCTVSAIAGMMTVLLFT